MQIDGQVTEVMDIYPLKEKFESFGFAVLKADGNNIENLLEVFQYANRIKKQVEDYVQSEMQKRGSN